MGWPEDNFIFKWELNNRVLYGEDGPPGCVGCFWMIIFIDVMQACFFTDFPVTPWIINFICKLFGIDLGLDE